MCYVKRFRFDTCFYRNNVTRPPPSPTNSSMAKKILLYCFCRYFSLTPIGLCGVCVCVVEHCHRHSFIYSFRERERKRKNDDDDNNNNSNNNTKFNNKNLVNRKSSEWLQAALCKTTQHQWIYTYDEVLMEWAREKQFSLKSY